MASPHEFRGLENLSCLPCTESNQISSLSRRSDKDSIHEEMKQTEDVLANELSKLSMKERSEAYDDVHCVGDELHETPEMIQKSLLEFNQAIPKYRNAAYDMAWNQNKVYVEDSSFRLKFLRAELHNVDQAVRKMMKFLRCKGEYFGEDKLGRDITFADLTDEDVEVMLSGFFHVQAGRDRMGRIIVYWFSKMVGRFKPEATFRAWYYVWYNMLIPLPEVQMKGLVEIYIGTPRSEEDGIVLQQDASFRKMLDAGSSMPFRNSANHYCFKRVDNRSMIFDYGLVALYVSGLSLYSRVRARIHSGTMIEIQYKLRSHGIPIDTFPVDMNGAIRHGIINLWFYEHQPKEGTNVLSFEGMDGKGEGNPSTVTVELREVSREAPNTKVESITPSQNDVLLGTGRFFQEHPGNVRFRKFVEDHSAEYDRLDRRERGGFNIRLTHELSANNVRFLKQNTWGDWFPVNPHVVRKKISQHFRTIRRKK